MNHVLLANGRRIACRVQGPGEGLPLVLLHGFCEDSSVWDGLMPALRNIRIIRVDLPGFGGSDLPVAPGMDVYADAVCAALNELSVERCILFGHSMGGYAALEFAEKYPERLTGLGLFHSHPYEDTPERKENRRRGIEMLQSGKRDLYVAQLFPGLFARSFAKAHPEIIEALIDKGKKQSADGIAGALQGMIERKSHLETLRAAGCPVSFVFGSEDTIITADEGLKAAVLPAVADLHVLPGVGHMGMFEAPEKSVAILREFWEFCAG